MTTSGSRKGQPPLNVRDVEEGQTVRLANGDLAVVTSNPKDGYWLEIRYVSGPEASSEEGQQEMVFAEDVVELVLD